MGWLFGRHRKSQAEKTLEELQRQPTTAGRFDLPESEPLASPPDPVGPSVTPDDSSAPSVGTEFAMRIDNKFSITGRGLVLTGTIDSGSVRVGQQVKILRQQYGPTAPATVLAIESFRKARDTARAGEEIGLLVRGLSRDDVNAGDRIVG